VIQVSSFGAGPIPIAPQFALQANLLFGPILELAILESWAREFAGIYTGADSAIVQISVNYTAGILELTRLESKGTDLLAVFAFLFNVPAPRSELTFYLWPGNNELSWRYIP
jgi:hypothetical protein